MMADCRMTSSFRGCMVSMSYNIRIDGNFLATFLRKVNWWRHNFYPFRANVQF